MKNSFYLRLVPLTLILLLFTLLHGSKAMAAGPEVWGVNYYSAGLSRFDASTGQQLEFVGELNPDPAIYTTPIALTSVPQTGEILVWNNSNPSGILLSVDPATGLATPVNASTPEQNIVMDGIAFGPGGKLYGSGQAGSINNPVFRQIEPSTGVATEIAQLPFRIKGLAFNNQGDLYGVEISLGPERLVRIDPATAAVTEIGTLTEDIGVIGDIVFTADGRLIGTAFNSSLPAGPYIFFDINPTTAEVTDIRASNAFPPQGMALVEPFSFDPSGNNPPVADPGGPYNSAEGSPVALDGTGSSDTDGDPLNYSWSVDSTLCDFDDATVVSPTLTCADNGSYQVTLEVSDGETTVSATAAVEVSNVAPTINAILTPTDPVALDTQPVKVSVEFSDPGTADTHTTTIDWGDGTNDTTENPSPVTLEHTYAAAGVYTLQVSVEDDDNGGETAVYEYIVIYDGSSFVTGHGRIYSEPGWCELDTACQNAEGNARFDFDFRYRRGAITPTSRTDFVFGAGSFGFQSTDYHWLIVNRNGSNAQFRGEGLVNGTTAPDGSAYQFMIWAGDDDPDTFGIKIWYEEGGQEEVVYDTGSDQKIGRGNIKVQAK